MEAWARKRGPKSTKTNTESEIAPQKLSLEIKLKLCTLAYTKRRVEARGVRKDTT